MSDLDDLLDRLGELAARIDELPEEARADVVALLDGLDTLHRSAVEHLAEALGDERVAALGAGHPAIGWLFDAYVRGDEREQADAALDQVRPFIHSHGGEVEVLDATDGVVRVRLAGACSGCTASAVTLQHGVEEALAEHLPTFVRLEVDEDAGAAPHPPPGLTLLEERPRLPLHPG